MTFRAVRVLRPNQAGFRPKQYRSELLSHVTFRTGRGGRRLHPPASAMAPGPAFDRGNRTQGEAGTVCRPGRAASRPDRFIPGALHVEFAYTRRNVSQWEKAPCA